MKVATQKNEEINGTFSSSRWTNPDQTFLIGTLADGTTIKGSISENSRPLPGVPYRFVGKWENNPTYGKQFSFSAFIQAEPHTYHGVIEYLLRNTSECGLGRATAHQIIDTFGQDKAIATLKRNPEAVSQAIPRWGLANAKAAASQLIACEKFEQTKVDLLDLFAGRGFPGELVEACVRRFGIHAPKRIKNDPWTLLVCHMPGCGFARVDRLYTELGLSTTRLKRQTICIWHAMKELAFSTGSTWHARGEIETKVGELVSGEIKFDKALELGIRARWIKTRVMDGLTWLATKADAEDEQQVAEYLGELCS